MTKDKFNQALAVLEGLGFKRLRDTPLADRLFHQFDKVIFKCMKSKTGYVSENEFVSGISEILSDRNNAIICTNKKLT